MFKLFAVIYLASQPPVVLQSPYGLMTRAACETQARAQYARTEALAARHNRELSGNVEFWCTPALPLVTA